MPTLPQCKRIRSRSNGGGGSRRHSRGRLISRNNLQQEESLADATGTEVEAQPNSDGTAEDEFKFLLTISDLVPLNGHYRRESALAEATGPAGEKKKVPLAAKSSCGRAAESAEDEDESAGAMAADSANSPNGFIVRLTGILPYLADS